MCVKKHRSVFVSGLLICLTALIGFGRPMTAMAQGTKIEYEYGGGVSGTGEIEHQKYYLAEETAKTDTVEAVLIRGVETMSPRIDVSSYKIKLEDFKAIWADVIYNTGTCFVVGNSWAYEKATEGETVYAVAVWPNYDSQYTVSDVQAYIAKRNAVLATVLQPGMTDVEKALALHDYLVAYNSYDLSYSGYSAYDALIRKTSVCDGYAKCYSDLLRTIGMDAMRVTSSSMNHAWNVVKLGEDWYHVDCTWDDPVRTTNRFDKQVREHPANGWTGRVRHNNFLLSDTGIASAGSGHQGWMSAVECTSTKYDSNADWSGIDSAFIFAGADRYMIKTGSDGCGLYKNNTEFLLPIAGKWYSQNGGIWGASYNCLSYDSGYLFYNDSQKVYAVSPGDTASRMDYTYPGTGDIYGCLVENARAILLIHERSDTTNYRSGDRSVTVTLDLETLGIDTPELAAPRLAGVSCGPIGVKVRWEAVTGAENYRVLRKTDGGNWTALGCTTETCYTDTNVTDGTDYVYTVQCMSADGKTEAGPYSEVGLSIRWEKPAVAYTITYHLSGGTNSSENPDFGTLDAEIVLKNATRAGYVFVGWYTEETFQNKITSIPAGTETDIVLYAKWEAEHTEHTYDGGEVTKKATCAEEGVLTYTCTVCGATKTDVIAKTDVHSYDGGKVTKKATCAAEGEITYTCTICKAATKTDKIAKTDAHSYDGGKVTKKATCAAEGEVTYTCTICKETKTDKIAKTNTHSYDGGKVTKKATCAAEGEITYTCTICKAATKTDKIAKTNTHSYDGGKVTKKATCAAEGEITYTCTVCKAATKTDKIAKTNAHSYDSGKVTKKATCAAEGEITYTCTVCKAATKTDKITKTNAHSYDSGRVTEEPTCSDTGIRTYTCELCGDTREEEIERDAEKHTYDDGVLTRRATCAQEGAFTYTCMDCGATKTETIEKTPHVFKNVIVAATPARNGSITPVCGACGEEKPETVISRPKTIKLSATSFTYNGKEKKPSLIVKDAGGKTIDSSNYEVAYAGERRDVGRYQVTVRFKGDYYSGSKTLTFEIDPAGTKLKSVKPGSRKLTVKWAKNTKQVTGYEIQYSTSKNFTKNTTKTVIVKSNTLTSTNLKGLKAKKKYYIRIRTYKTVGGETFVSDWSKASSAVTKR